MLTPFVSCDTFPSSMTLLVFIAISVNRVDVDWTVCSPEAALTCDRHSPNVNATCVTLCARTWSLWSRKVGQTHRGATDFMQEPFLPGELRNAKGPLCSLVRDSGNHR